ncbi:hypothetical protein GCM10010517_59200 [Streptosporangium fragile]|uniref:Thioesterase family protein n=1 Tax=Streptosporangium fragile TaxID=46186 RepID=A0ABN3W7E1_9ACTN
MKTPIHEVRVPERFRGPEGTANGGWISGLVASYLPAGRAVEVTLRAPTPLETVLRIECAPPRVRLLHGSELLVEAGTVDDDPLPPPFVSPEQAAAAERNFPGMDVHPFPGCFVCGDRKPGEGLRIHPGPTGEPGMFAALWHVHHGLAEWSQTLPLCHVWGALDCPTGWTHLIGGGAALLGRLTAHVRRPVRPGATYVVVARNEGTERRKRFASGAVYELGGRLVGASSATWIAV